MLLLLINQDDGLWWITLKSRQINIKIKGKDQPEGLKIFFNF